jgi:hypothetical protein
MIFFLFIIWGREIRSNRFQAIRLQRAQRAGRVHCTSLGPSGARKLLERVTSKNLMPKLGACKLSTHCKSFEAHRFFVIHVFLATHSQISDLYVDCFVEICMGVTLSMKCIKLAQKTTVRDKQKKIISLNWCFSAIKSPKTQNQ